ncbi:uncharacterized protein, partial [Palaemon carinicauda]|uniref:uncharacterized protein n=1 Tax=Palaemon carinicauda TaxID=392227 RepID=UPI0035B600A8
LAQEHLWNKLRGNGLAAVPHPCPASHALTAPGARTLDAVETCSDTSEICSEVPDTKHPGGLPGKEWCSSSSGYHSGIGTSEVSHGDHPAFDTSLTSGETSDDDDDSDWGEDEWPIDRALPLPEWGCERPELNFGSLQSYCQFLGHVRGHLERALSTQCYDTISNFIAFGKEYQCLREEYPALEEFYRDYDPPLLPGRYTCVGLSCDLATTLSMLEVQYPGLKDAAYQVSCEEEIDNVDWYCSNGVPPVTTCEKEHVLICIRIRISGRAGVLLLDPGYHIGVPITVMEDGLAPQSGPIRANTTRANVFRSYQYRYQQDSTSFVSWEVVEERDGEVTHTHTSLIHIARPFLSGVDVAERRNLAYPFKTLLGRESSGKLRCGLYFPLRLCHETNVTFFHRADGHLHHTKVPLSYFSQEQTQTESSTETTLALVAAGTGRSVADLRLSLENVASLCQDTEFMKQLGELERAIDSISRDN